MEQVTDNALVSVEDMLGDLTTVATLRIKITRYESLNAESDMKQLQFYL